MRYQEIIGEAPLGDFELHGDAELGSFRADDLKAMRNPKWQEKLYRFFQKTPQTFNIYALNAETALYTHPDGHVEQLFLNLDNIERYAGMWDTEAFHETFGFLPPNYQNAITVLFTCNEGGQRVPFTQWIVAHRLFHVFQFGNPYTPSKTAIMDHGVMDFVDDIQAKIKKVRSFVWHGLDRTGALKMALQSSNRAWADEDAVAMAIGKTRAMRDGKLTSPAEMFPEFGAQYLLTGRVTFNHGVDLGKYTWSINGYHHDQASFDKWLDEAANELTRLYGELLSHAVGKIFVL